MLKIEELCKIPSNNESTSALSLLMECYNICDPSSNRNVSHSTMNWNRRIKTEVVLSVLYSMKENHDSLSCTSILYFLRIDSQRVNNVNHYIFNWNLFIYNQTLSDSSPLIFKLQIHDKRKWFSHKKNHWYQKVKAAIYILRFEYLRIVYIFGG